MDLTITYRLTEDDVPRYFVEVSGRELENDSDARFIHESPTPLTRDKVLELAIGMIGDLKPERVFFCIRTPSSL